MTEDYSVPGTSEKIKAKNSKWLKEKFCINALKKCPDIQQFNTQTKSSNLTEAGRAIY